MAYRFVINEQSILTYVIGHYLLSSNGIKFRSERDNIG